MSTHVLIIKLIKAQNYYLPNNVLIEIKLTVKYSNQKRQELYSLSYV